MTNKDHALTILIPLALAFGGGCGEIGNDGYQGDPAMRVNGVLQGDVGGADIESPHVAVLWIRMDLDEGAWEHPIVGQIASISATEFPAEFDFDLFDLPDPTAMMELEDEDGQPAGKLAVGLIIAVDDLDGDGQFLVEGGQLVSDDLMFGVAFTNLLTYVEDAPTPGAGLGFSYPLFTNPEDATPGFHVLHNLCIREDTGEVVPGEDWIGDVSNEVSADARYEVVDDATVRIYLNEPGDHYPKDGEQPGCDII